MLLLSAFVDDDGSDSLSDPFAEKGVFTRGQEFLQKLFLSFVDLIDPECGDIEEIGVVAGIELLLFDVFLFLGKEGGVFLADRPHTFPYLFAQPLQETCLEGLRGLFAEQLLRCWRDLSDLRIQSLLQL